MLSRLAVAAMGTRFELVLEGEDEARARAAGEEALRVIEQCDLRYSLFRQDSMIARINRVAAERPVRLDEETFELLQACLALRDATDGAFDVTIGPLMRALGFHAGTGERDIACERGTFELDAQRRGLRFTAPNTSLDLGSIAKGHALDLAAAKLRECGVERALLHGGTSGVVALGAPPEQRGWRVALGAEPEAPVAVLCDNALSMSAPHGRCVDFAGHSVGHLLDPRSGRPVPQATFAVVVARSARVADAWSTAALVLAARGAPLMPPDELSLHLRAPDGSVLTRGDASVFEFPEHLQAATR